MSHDRVIADAIDELRNHLGEPWDADDSMPNDGVAASPLGKAHIAKGRATWAEGSCIPERFIVAGERIIVLSHVRVRLKHETQWREGDVADVFTFRNGKAIQFHTFADEQQAFEWAGVKAADAD